MSFKLAEAFVDIKANDKDLDSKLALAKGKLTRFADAMKSIAIPLGATLGAASSGMIGAVAGRTIGHRISTRAVNIGSAVLFAAFGIAMLAGWF